MPGNASPTTLSPQNSLPGAFLSMFLPGSGQWVRGYPTQAIWIFGTGVFLGIGTWQLSIIGGSGAGFFFGLLIILPWWCLQAYAAYLPSPKGQWETLKLIWERGHDIRYLGGLFLITAVTDLYIILVNPEYALTVFCSKPGGPLGVLAKAQSPILHVAIGYGFLRLQRWSLFVYLAYASFGLLNSMANYACLGFGRIRMVFFFSLLAFSAYVIWRRKCFSPPNPSALATSSL